MRADHSARPRRYWVALIFLLLGTVAAAWHNRAVDQGRPDPVAGLARGVVTPPASLLSRIGQWFGDQTGGIGQGRRLAEENRLLKERVAQLEGENAKLREAEINYERLKDDLGFVKAQKRPPLAAPIIARRSDQRFDTFVIGRGSRDGVRPNSIVVAPNGVVGRVYDVSATTAAVLMLTDENSRVGARVQRANSRVVGICRGKINDPLLWLSEMPSDADIKQGDVILTSGLGGVFPSGLVIGEVTEVAMEQGNLLKTARVKPKVAFDKLEEVYVLQ